jgi:alanine dehydrogenase
LGITAYYGGVSIQAAVNQGVLLTGGSIGLNSANISLGYGGSVSVNGSLIYNSQTLSLIAAYDRSGNPIVVLGYYG